MIIKKVHLNNFRIYQGENQLEFIPDPNKKVFIISGENGFGKTTFLTSLVWCLYGKLMVDVDEKYKREIYEAGGYKRYAKNNLNRSVESVDQYSVSLVLSDLHIPSIPCNEVKITRSFNLKNNEDSVEILIDGNPNELTKAVGSEIFIHDFILPKEVAKFFFFDAEKIVSLAEMKSLEEKQRLSKAYSEVLGVKKYVDLKHNLEDLRLRFKRNSATKSERKKLEGLSNELQKVQKLSDFNTEQIALLNDEKEAKKKQSEQYQEKLIREGNSISVEELIDLKKLRGKLSDEGKKNRAKLKELLELAPFAIAGAKLKSAHLQAKKEAAGKATVLDPKILNEKLENIETLLVANELQELGLDNKLKGKLISAFKKHTLAEFTKTKKEVKTLLEFSDSEYNEFNAIWENLKYSFSSSFKQLLKDDKTNKYSFNKVIRKITDAESQENDLLVREIRNEKTKADEHIRKLENQIAELNQDVGSAQREISVISRQISELSKKVQLDESDKKKDQVAEKLIANLGVFISKLKADKKETLEGRIKKELNLLMHKKDFVHHVEVEINEDLIDINLFDSSNQTILKESLSKGEQQLYATSILKALVDESNIKFPIFIDSPLQKFDKRHSKNIIGDFYPNISDQVVLFPLLEKELSVQEFEDLLPHINSTFIINNIDYDRSKFEKVNPNQLFDTYHEHVYSH